MVHYNCNCLGLVFFLLFFTRFKNALGKPFPVDTIIFRLTCGFIHISLSDSAHSAAYRLCWSFILKSSPHTPAKETKIFIFPLTLRGFLPAEKRNLMSSERIGLKHTLSKNFWKSKAKGVRCSWLKGKGALTGLLDSTTGVFEDMNISRFPTHFLYTTLLPFVVQLLICWTESLEEHNCFFLLAACKINGVEDMKESAKN